MGRPRKNSGAPDAQQRIITAFWDLLEMHQLREINVGVIAAKADCNRGTFYYHYRDINDLIEAIIENELLKDNVIPRAIFGLVTGVNQQSIRQTTETIMRHFNRLNLLIEKGGMSIINSKIKTAIVKMWEAVFCIEGTGLNEQSRYIIEYASSGILGVISFSQQQENQLNTLSITEEFRADMSEFMLNQISKSQGVPKEEILSRLMMIGRFTDLPSTSAG